MTNYKLERQDPRRTREMGIQPKRHPTSKTSRIQRLAIAKKADVTGINILNSTGDGSTGRRKALTTKRLEIRGREMVGKVRLKERTWKMLPLEQLLSLKTSEETKGSLLGTCLDAAVWLNCKEPLCTGSFIWVKVLKGIVIKNNQFSYEVLNRSHMSHTHINTQGQDFKANWLILSLRKKKKIQRKAICCVFCES